MLCVMLQLFPKQQTANFWHILNVSGDILSRIHSVLDHMHQLSINLPILLWAISWNMEGLIDDALVLQDNDGIRQSASETQDGSGMTFLTRCGIQSIRRVCICSGLILGGS